VSRAEQGLGSVKKVRNRAGEVIGHQAFLPREYSIPPKGCKRPDLYQQPIGERQPTEEAARSLLIEAIRLRRAGIVPSGAISFATHLSAEIQARHHDARRIYKTDRGAKRVSATLRSIDRVWLSKAPFYDVPPESIDLALLQGWFTWLSDVALKKDGSPLSAHYVHKTAALVKAVLDRAGLKPNPAEALKLPDTDDPRVPFLDLPQQRQFYGSERVPMEGRCAVGCGMGAGLRVGELLSLEVVDLHLDEHDPHLFVRYGGPDHAPPKGRRIRRVELYEPGLGFFRLWMKTFYQGGPLVFGGPRGGYRKEWADNFPGWGDSVGLPNLTSHIMRHTFAVSVLSGTWGYDPKGLDFVQQQLGHSNRSTTERYYGAFEVGTWQREARRMRGDVEMLPRVVVTARSLLGLESESESPPSSNWGNSAGSGRNQLAPRQSPPSSVPVEKQGGSLSPAELAAQAASACESALAAAAAGEATALAQAIVALGKASRTLRGLAERLESPSETEREVG
jgi:integrase